MSEKKYIVDGGGGNSPNGGGGPSPIGAGSGSGDNQWSFLNNAYPLGSPATPSTKQEIIAELASGLRFYPDAVMYATDLRLIDPFYHLKPLVLTKLSMCGEIADSDGPEIPLSFTSDFVDKRIISFLLHANVETEIVEAAKVKMLILMASSPISISLNGGPFLPPQGRFMYGNANVGITSLKVLAEIEGTEVQIYSFTGR